jgi:hypothetical protein
MSAIPFPAAARWYRPTAERSAATKHGPLPALVAGERILVRQEILPGHAVIGTDQAVHLSDGPDWRRIPWVEVDFAGWDAGASRVVLKLWAAQTTSTPVLAIPADHRFAAFAAERLHATQVLRRRVRLATGAAATVVALRAPGDDSLQWRVHVEYASADDEASAAAAHEVLTRLRALVGT